MLYICLIVFWMVVACSGALAASGAEAGRRISTIVRADPRTGRLVRAAAVIPRVIVAREADSGDGAPEASRSAVAELVEQAAKAYDLDPLLVHSVIKMESNYNPYAISNKGAEGLMQLIPATARRFGAKNSFSPKENIDAGVRYLKYLKTVFGDDRLALAAYNAGEGAVTKYGWIPPYAETQDYVYRVGKHYGDARRAADVRKAAQPAQAKVTAHPVEEHPKLEQYRDEQGRVYFRTR